MAKNKEKVVEQEVVEAVEPTEAEAEVKQPSAQVAVVISVDQEGQFFIQDGYSIFGEGEVERMLSEADYNDIIKTLAKNIERAEIVADVKRELAQTFGGAK